ncbi:CopD family protein [uncultured Sphingomonas sp.]|uniref:CopD family protein n=1 Tax=uncultured Sphingomonas sp. TaxID=158754 RepID=UPI0035CA2123
MWERLLVAYDWIKAAHLIFVIFWMAGLFALPRYLIYHQENLADAADAARWVEREGKLRKIILTPAMIVVLALGVVLATMSGAWSQGWLHAKLLFVLGLTGYHGWAVGYARKLAAGRPTLSNKTLRMLNEVPALLIALIVVLVVVKP